MREGANATNPSLFTYHCYIKHMMNNMINTKDCTNHNIINVLNFAGPTSIGVEFDVISPQWAQPRVEFLKSHLGKVCVTHQILL